MVELEDVKSGWDFMFKLMGADLAAQEAFSDHRMNINQNQQIAKQNQKLQRINDEIERLTQSINNHPNLNLGVEQFKGFVAEEFSAGTFNIDALRKGSSHLAFTLQENSYGSVDIGTNFGKTYSLKYANHADKAESFQAVLNRDTRLPKYLGQELLIAPEQVEEAKACAVRREGRDLISRPYVAAAHGYAKDHLVGTISDGEGVESKALSIKEAKEISREAKNGGFDPEKHGIKKEPYLSKAQIDFLNQAVKAGLTAATITTITQLVPELYKSIDYLIKHGEIDVGQLKKSGKKVISASGEAFFRGSCAYLVQLAIEKGLFGKRVQDVDPTITGFAVVLLFETVKNSILVAAGKKTAIEMGMNFIDTLVVSTLYMYSTKMGATIAASFFPQIPLMSYAIGSLLGFSFAVVYNIGKNKLISFCVDTGFTCFGLVDQNYELPEKVLKELGIDTVKIETSAIETTPINRTQTNINVGRISYETVNLTVIRRGVIGVNKVGYVLV